MKHVRREVRQGRRSRMHSARMTLVVAAATLACALCSACDSNVVYRPRPGFATAADLPDEVVLEDGTVIHYISRTEYIARQEARRAGVDYAPPSAEADEKRGPAFVPWEEFSDGSVKMDALMPEHVIANTMRAFREEQFGALWDQMVATGVRRRAEAADGNDAARAKFIEWCAQSRNEVMTLLNRMSFGFSTNAVIMTKAGPTLLQLRLAPQVAGEFRFRVVEIEYEGDRVLLAGIR